MPPAFGQGFTAYCIRELDIRPEIDRNRRGKRDCRALHPVIAKGVPCLLAIMCLALSFDLVGCVSLTKFPMQKHADQIDEKILLGGSLCRDGRYPDALEAYGLALEMASESNDPRRLADISYRLGQVHLKQQKFDKALARFQDALNWARQGGDRKDEGYLLNRMGAVYQIQGDIIAAKKHYGQSLAIRRDMGDTLGQARTLANLAYVSFAERRYADALEEYREALTILNHIGPPSYRDIGAVRIDEDAHDQCGVVGPDQFTREQVLSRVAQDDGTEVILTDHPHGDVALAGIGHRDGDVLAHVDDRAAVQSVAVLADDRLVVE